MCCSGRAGAVRGTKTGFRTRGIAKVPSSEGCVPEVSKLSVFDGFDGLGSKPPRFGRNRFWNRVPRTGGIFLVPGSGDSIPKVPKVTLYFDSILLYFESVLIVL